MTGHLTTHVLDTASGRPARGMSIALFRIDDEGRARKLGAFVTNGDGRCDAPLLEGDTLLSGRYRLVFAAGAFFASQGAAVASPPFLDDITIDFGIADASQHYHVPLLVSPWSYATYRGS